MKKVLYILFFPTIALGQYTQIPDTTFELKLINLGYDSPSNFPKKNELIKGKVIHVGLDY